MAVHSIDTALRLKAGTKEVEISGAFHSPSDSFYVGGGERLSPSIPIM